MGQTRPFCDVGSMSGLPESGSRSVLLRCRKSGISGTGPTTPSPRRTGGVRDFAERQLWNIHAFPASVRLDACEPHHLAPLRGFLGDQLAEVSGRTRKYRAAEVSEPCFHIGIGKSSVDLLV